MENFSVNKSFFIVLLIATSLFFISDSSKLFIIPYLNIPISSAYLIKLKILLVLLIIIYLYWIYHEIKENNVVHSTKIRVCTRIRSYMKKKKAKKSENLCNEFGELINADKDIYYIDGKIILKTGNTYRDSGRGSEYQPEGYIFETSKFKYIFILARQIILVLLEKKVFPYIIFIFWAISLMCIYTVSLI